MTNYKAYNIDWDIDISDSVEQAMALPPEEFRSMFGFEKPETDNTDAVYSKLHHMPGLQDDLAGLPNEVPVPKNVYDACIEDGDYSALTDYLSDEYGYCINDYETNFSV